MNYIDKIFSDRIRPVMMGLSILILVLMGLLNAYVLYIGYPMLTEYVKDPEKYDLNVVKMYNDAVVVDAEENGFTINYYGLIMPVKYNGNPVIDKTMKNQRLSIRAIFHKEGYLEANKVHIHKYRYVKVYTSLFAVLMIFIVFISNYKFNVSKFTFEER